MIILGIETSCDETGISIYDKKYGIIINEIYSQALIHSKYGGIVPEIASRNHSSKIIPLIKQTIFKSKINFKEINAIAFTAGPGLSTSLIVGATTAITLAYLYNIPYIPINHIEGHILSVMIPKKKPNFPFISLVTSGAHTYLIIVKNYEKYKIIGQSLDDSAGETFDKISHLIGFKYPGGKKISKLSKYGKINFKFPKPMINSKKLNFSFSGLKTHIINFFNNQKIKDNQFIFNLAYSLEESITDILVKKTELALKKYKINNLSIVGGVSSNNKLRKKMKYMTKKKKKKLFLINKKLCTDNAAMIAYTGFIKLNNKKKIKKQNLEIIIKPTWKISEI